MTALVDAWQAALAAEQQAYFGYSLLGPRLSAAHQQLGYDTGAAHQVLRDTTANALLAAGHQPVAPAAGYALGTVADDAGAVALAVRLEQDCADAWRYLYAVSVSAPDLRAATVRTSAQSGLTASAVRGATWRRIASPGAPTVPFPGI